MSESDTSTMDGRLVRNSSLENVQKRRKMTRVLPDITYHCKPEKNNAVMTQQAQDFETRQVVRIDAQTDPSEKMQALTHDIKLLPLLKCHNQLLTSIL